MTWNFVVYVKTWIFCFLTHFELKNINFMLIIKKWFLKKILMKYANEKTRKCFFIIINFICDYEKQMIIIDVKNNQHCIICRISFKKREIFTRQWSFRTHEWTQKQIAFQKQKNIFMNNVDWIHDVECFV